MAKDITEIINAAAVVRDETGEAANTAARVGGSIADVAQYIQEEIITPLLTAQSQAVSAERIAEFAKKIAEEAAGKITAILNKDAEQDGKISSLVAKDATLDAKINELQERVLKYLYPKIYQLNEGAGARVFHGFYAGNASVSDERKTASEEGFSYKVVFKLGSFYLQEISPGGVIVCLYSSWDKIGDIASSESYAQRDCLYFIYVKDEGSTYYYIDSNGYANEKSATYLLRVLANKNASAIAALLTKNTDQDEKIAALKSALVSQSLSQVQENIFALCDSDGNIALKYDDLGFDVAKISEHFSSLLSNSISRKNLLQVIEVDEPGLYYVDAELNVGEKRDKTGTHAINLVEYINQ